MTDFGKSIIRDLYDEGYSMGFRGEDNGKDH